MVTELARAIPSAVALYFDDYASRKDFPENIIDWISTGGDVDVITTPLLQAHLSQLMNGKGVSFIRGNGWAKEYGIENHNKEEITIQPSKIIILEEPFGRERMEIREFIDYVIYIDIEPEIALGRRIYDLIKFLRSDSTVLINLLDHYLFDYLNNGIREMYVEIGKRVRENSDLVIKGRVRLEDNIQIVLNKIKKLNGY
ncbi:hypothetical protein ACFQZT_29075 [Paenibacillus sp. GCM10027628]|uniref:hypothetical protein n=1 Tax=Paenibacillus sp. GCM10027628 TaxID=3273413 RepID=UPI00363BE3CC